MTNPPNSSPPIEDALGQSLKAGWERMVWLLFTGPEATPVNWMKWGVILLLAGVSGNFPGGSGGSGGDSSFDDFESSFALADAWFPIEVFAAITCSLLVIAVVGFIVSCFNFVFLEGVLRGRPAIRSVFPSTVGPGLQYFLFQFVFVLILVLGIGGVALAMFGGEWYDLDDDSVAPIVIFAFCCGCCPLIAAAFILQWLVYDFAIPLTWRRGLGIMDGISHTLTLVSANIFSVIIYGVVRLVLGIVGWILSLIVIVLTCCLWLLPAMLGIALVAVSAAAPILFVVTIPLMIASFLVTAWIMATITAPIPIFGRCWSYAFIQQLDPSIGGWDDDPSPSQTTWNPPPPSTPPRTVEGEIESEPDVSAPDTGQDAGSSDVVDSPLSADPSDGRDVTPEPPSDPEPDDPDDSNDSGYRSPL